MSNNMCPDISYCVSSNRPSLWSNLYLDMKKASGSLSFEIIAVGPIDPNFPLPSNFKYIKTGNIKVPQCFEISMKNFQGKNICFIGDDSFFCSEKDVEKMYKEYEDMRNKYGGFSIILPRLVVSGQEQPLRYAKLRHAPIASLNCALIDRSVLDRIGGADINFLSVYWDCDMAMRFHEMGGHIDKSANIICKEHIPSSGIYLHRSSKPHDKGVLDKLWTKVPSPEEKDNPDVIWCYMKDRRTAVLKKRLSPFVGYKDVDIFIKSQGVREYGNLKWD